MSPATPRSADQAFTLLELLVVAAIVAIMIAVAFPAFSPRRPMRAYMNNCSNNLRQVSSGFTMWAIEHGDNLPWQTSTNAGGSMELIANGMAEDHFLRLSNYIQAPRCLRCPSDAARPAAENYSHFGNANLSYFASLANATNDAFVVLSGERHLEIEGKPLEPGFHLMTDSTTAGWTRELHSQMPAATGNLLFADGHTEFVKTDKLPATFRRQTVATNQLVIP